jgi:ATP-dependent protease ClpP protease subunit
MLFIGGGRTHFDHDYCTHILPIHVHAKVQLVLIWQHSIIGAIKHIMRTTRTRTHSTAVTKQKALPLFVHQTARWTQYFGMVNYATTERVIEEIGQFMNDDPYSEIFLSVTSAGGPTGTAMSFYDHIRYVLRPSLTTIGAGDVDSSGVIIFLSGEKRYLAQHTTLLLHRAGRVFEIDKRITASELEAMYREDTLKDMHYASVVAENSGGKLNTQDVLELMDGNTILTPADAVAFGICDGILT